MAENASLTKYNPILDGPRDDGTPRVTLFADEVHMTYNVLADRRSGSVVGRRKRMRFRALNGVSFVAREGEFIGLVGRNGSGKSTLLRTLAGVEPPTKGTVLTSSKPQLLGVSAALMPDLSGEENIRLGLLAMGLSPNDVLERRNRIADLSGLGEALRMPMRTYSSGMGARLRFAISVAADPNILMIDEALSTGDASFMERSRKAMEKMIDSAGTVFLVSHAAQTIEQLCTRAIWLERGEIIADGPAVDVARAYRWYAHNLAQDRIDKAATLLQDARQSTAQRRKAIRENSQVIRRKSYAEATGQLEVVSTNSSEHEGG